MSEFFCTGCRTHVPMSAVVRTPGRRAQCRGCHERIQKAKGAKR